MNGEIAKEVWRHKRLTKLPNSLALRSTQLKCSTFIMSWLGISDDFLEQAASC